MIHSRACWAAANSVAGRLPSRVLRALLGDLEGDDVLALHRLADDDQLGDVGVVGGDLFELLLEAAGPAVRAEDRVALGGEARRHLGRRLAVDLLQLEVDALVGELVRLLTADHDLDIELATAAGTTPMSRGSMPDARSVSSSRRSSVPT